MLSKDITDIIQDTDDIVPFFWPPSEGDFKVSNDYTFTTSGEAVIKTFDNFFIPEKCTVQVSNICKGIYLNILGDCTIEGTISMSNKGIGGSSPYVGIDTRYGIFYSNDKALLNDKLHIPDQNIIPNNGKGNRCTGLGGTRHT